MPPESLLAVHLCYSVYIFFFTLFASMAGSLKPRSQSDAVRNVQTLSSEKISREIPEKISATMDER